MNTKELTVAKEQFTRFLEKRELKEKFEHNLSTPNCGRFENDETSYDKYLNDPSLADETHKFVVCAFMWEYTPEGHDFWEEIDKDWKSFCGIKE